MTSPKITLPGFIEIAVRRQKQCASINLRLAREARESGNLRKRIYHLEVARRCRRDGRELINVNR